jgi:hypothetical protein
MIVTLRAGMGIYQAQEELSLNTIGTLTGSYALGPNCQIIDPVYELVDKLRHAGIGAKRNFSMILCRDLATKPGQIHLALVSPDASFGHAMARREEVPITLADERYQPIIAVQYNYAMGSYILRQQSKGFMPPLLSELSETIYIYLESLFSVPSDVRQQTHSQTHVLSALLLESLPEQDTSQTSIGKSALEGRMTEIAGRARRIKAAQKKETAK